MNRFKITTLAVGIALATSVHAASFFEIEAGIGGADYARGPDGEWVQDGFEHKVNLTAPAIEAGITGDLYQAQRWGLSWHADWAWLGQIHSQSMATPVDSNYNTITKACNGPCLPLADYTGSGHDQGFLFTLEPHLDYGAWRFGVEAGPYVHSSTWSEDVTGWHANGTGPEENLHVSHQPKWLLGYVIGASIHYKALSLSYQFFHNQRADGDPTPPIWQNTQMLMVKYTADIF